MAFWRSPHGPLGSGPPRAGYSQRRMRKEKGEKKKRRRKKRKGKKRREEREDLRPIWAGYSVFRLCTSLYTRPLKLQFGKRLQEGLHITDIGP